MNKSKQVSIVRRWKTQELSPYVCRMNAEIIRSRMIKRLAEMRMKKKELRPLDYGKLKNEFYELYFKYRKLQELGNKDM